VIPAVIAGRRSPGQPERLSPLDAAFLAVEDHDPNASVAMGLLVVLEGSVPGADEIDAVVSARVTQIPRLRQVVRRSWWDLEAPRWVEDPSFDLTRHVRRAAVPGPGGDDELTELVARLMESRLDRARPLWELWVIEGVGDGGWALLVKGHHCLADGLTGLAMFRDLLADRVDGVDRLPDQAGLKASVRRPSTVLGLPRLLTGAVASARGLLAYAGDLLPLRASGLAGPVGQGRRFRTFDLPLDAVRGTAHAHAVTINDLVLAGVTAGLREALLGAGADPARVTVRSLVPVAVGAPDAARGPGNRLSMLLPRLPVEVADPVARLREVELSVSRARADHEVEAGAVLTAAAAGQPYAATAWLVDLLTRRPQLSVAAVTTNVRGPAAPVAVLGHRVARMIPYVGLGMGLRLGVAVLSYDNRLAFGISADDDLRDELDAVVAGLQSSIRELEVGWRDGAEQVLQQDAPGWNG
jgi:diacylglycerol O-acyltransferase